MKNLFKGLMLCFVIIPCLMLGLTACGKEKTEPYTFDKLLSQITAAQDNTTISFTGDITNQTEGESGILKISDKDVTVDFGTYTYQLDLPNASSTTENWVGLRVTDGANVVLQGTTGGIKTADNGELYAVLIGTQTVAADVTIKGGSYIGGTTSVQVTKGTLTIEGGFFACQDEDTTFVINCWDTNYNNDSANIIVKGGTFVNFNPADNEAETGDHINFVAEGFKVVEDTQSNGDVWYTVVPDAE